MRVQTAIVLRHNGRRVFYTLAHYCACLCHQRLILAIEAFPGYRTSKTASFVHLAYDYSVLHTQFVFHIQSEA